MKLKLTIAGKFEIVEKLLNPPIHDEEGNVIGYSEPIISKEEALELLKFPKEGERE